MLEFSEVQLLYEIVISRKSVGVLPRGNRFFSKRFLRQSNLNVVRLFVRTNEFLSQMKSHTERHYTYARRKVRST